MSKHHERPGQAKEDSRDRISANPQNVKGEDAKGESGKGKDQADTQTLNVTKWEATILVLLTAKAMKELEQNYRQRENEGQEIEERDNRKAEINLLKGLIKKTNKLTVLW